MTWGELAGLRAGLDDGGEAVIQRVRRDGRKLRVEDLSDGTRDQLYLAQRLARPSNTPSAASPSRW